MVYSYCLITKVPQTVPVGTIVWQTMKDAHFACLLQPKAIVIGIEAVWLKDTTPSFADAHILNRECAVLPEVEQYS